MTPLTSERLFLKLEESANLKSPSPIAAVAIPCTRGAQHWSSTRNTQLSIVVGPGEIGLNLKPQVRSQLITTVTRS
jgi:hypothetical protein